MILRAGPHRVDLPGITQATRYPSRAAWLRASVDRLGASNVPKVLGLSPYGGPWDVWTEKALGHRRRRGRAQHLEAGLIAERGTCQLWSLTTGGAWLGLDGQRSGTSGDLLVGPLGELTLTGAEPWQGFTPDAVAYSYERQSWGVTELKVSDGPTPGAMWADGEARRFPWAPSGLVLDHWSPEAARGIREDYACQLYAQMLWSGVSWGQLIVRVGVGEVRVYTLLHDAEVMGWIDEQTRAFWSLVERRRAGDEDAAPTSDGSEAEGRAWALLVPDEEEVCVEPSPALSRACAAWLWRWRAARRMEGSISAARTELAEAMAAEGVNAVRTAGGVLRLQRGAHGRYPRFYPDKEA